MTNPLGPVLGLPVKLKSIAVKVTIGDREYLGSVATVEALPPSIIDGTALVIGHHRDSAHPRLEIGDERGSMTVWATPIFT
jgi:hypothetical protein